MFRPYVETVNIPIDRVKHVTEQKPSDTRKLTEIIRGPFAVARLQLIFARDETRKCFAYALRRALNMHLLVQVAELPYSDD
jgi:hypothetical protein